MIPFELHTPTTLDEALGLLAQYGDEARPIAGGTALVLLMEQHQGRPAHLVNLGRVAGLSGITTENGSLRIGAGTPHRLVEMNPAVKQGWSLLAETYARVATVRIRNVATVGGGLAHADPNQDPPPSYIALNARVQIASRQGTREVAMEDLFRDYYETQLQPGEVITEVVVPRPIASLRTAYLKFLPRTADDYPTVGVAVALDVQDGRCVAARIALNAVGPTVVRAREAENVLRGQMLNPDLLREAAATVPAITDPISDHRGSANYKSRMAEVFTRRALERALAA
ncbi:MAG: xanthine dehydrogenase family protein subunit M [Chloroflexi bacterium]|nr:xanthine dehydrogenase family protein subunit M [Chloroflexota bacterium]